MKHRLTSILHSLAGSVLLGSLCLLATACGSGVRIQAPSTQTSSPNPSPVISSFKPAFIVAASQPTTLTISGSGFENATTVMFGSKSRTVLYIDPQTISIQLDASDLATPGNYSITASNSSPGGGNVSATYEVWQTVPDKFTGISLAMPPFNATVSLGTDTSPDGVIQLYPAITAPNSSTVASGFFLEIYQNPKNLSLQQWFEANIDVNGTLINSGAYESSTLVDGRPVLINETGAPAAYYAAGGDADFYYAYAETPTGQVVAIQRSWENDLYDQGYISPSVSLTDLELSVLSTVRY